MKNNIFGYLFILFIVIIMIYAIYRVNVYKSKESSDINSANETTASINKGTDITLAISEFDTINPIITNNRKVQDIDKLIFEPLISITEDYNIEYILASECVKSSENTYVIRLRQGVKWSDGTKFTSDDVKFTIDKLKENSNSVYAQNVSFVNEVDIIDNYTLKIILSHDVNNFKYYLNFPILSNNYYNQENFWNTEKNKAPISTGQFVIAEVNNNTIVIQKNKNWWNKQNNSIINKITINLYSSVAELYNAFKMGNVDFITTENAQYQDYIGTIGYDVSQVEGREFIFLALNTSNGILSDVNVRKAIRSALNKDIIIAESYGSMYSKSSFPLNYGNYLINKQDENFYNIDEMRELLTLSGWELKNGIWQKLINYKVKLLELNMVVRASDTVRCKAAESIKNNLGNEGIIINIIYANDSDYNAYLNNIKYDILLADINQSIAPDLTTYLGKNNLANYYNNEIDEIMSYLNNITDENELKNKYQRIYDIYNLEVPYIGIARNKIYAIKNTNIVGDIKANWYNMFYNISMWYITK